MTNKEHRKHSVWNTLDAVHDRLILANKLINSVSITKSLPDLPFTLTESVNINFMDVNNESFYTIDGTIEHFGVLFVRYKESYTFDDINFPFLFSDAFDSSVCMDDDLESLLDADWGEIVNLLTKAKEINLIKFDYKDEDNA